jgi:hypothetical protein
MDNSAAFHAIVLVAGLIGVSRLAASQVPRASLDIRAFAFATFDGQQHQSELGKLTVPEYPRRRWGASLSTFSCLTASVPAAM